MSFLCWGLHLHVGSSLELGVTVPPARSSVGNRSLVFYRVCLPRAWREPSSAEKQCRRRASEGKGKIINLPRPNQSFVAGIGSIGSVTYPSYRGKNIPSDKSNSLIAVDDVTCNCNSKWQRGCLTASVARISQPPCTSCPST